MICFPHRELTVARVLQSAREWLLEGAMEVEFVHAALLMGGGKLLLGLGCDLERRHCLLWVTVDEDNLCCARALVVCRAFDKGQGNLRVLLRSPNNARAPSRHCFDEMRGHSTGHAFRCTQVVPAFKANAPCVQLV